MSFLKNILSLILVLVGVYFAHRLLTVSSKRNLVVLAMAIFFIAGFIYWKKMLLVIPFWILVEGYVRRYYYDSTWILFVKDMGLLAVYLRVLFLYLQGKVSFETRNTVSRAILILFVFYVLELFNPELPSFVQGILAIKVMFFYVPYFYLTKYLFTDKKQFFRYLFFYILLAIPIGLYAYVQYMAGPEAAHPQDVFFHTGTGDIVLRPSSTFYFNSAFSHYTYIIFTLLMAAINIKYFNRRWLILGLVIAASLASILLSGQRIVWVTLVLQFSLFAIFGYNISKRFRIIPKTVAVLSVVAIILLSFFPGLKDTTLRRVETLTDLESFGDVPAVEQQDTSFKTLWENSPLLGHGPGTATPASRYLPSAVVSSEVEGGHVQIAWEIGFIGLSVFIFMLIQLFAFAWKTAQDTYDRELRLIGLFTALLPVGFLIINVTTGILNVSSSSILFWFSMGFVFVIKAMDKQSQEPKA